MRWLAALLGLTAACVETRVPGEVKTARASLSIDVLEPGVRQLQEASGTQFDPSLARSGDVLLVAWSDTRFGFGTTYRVLGVRVTADGGSLDSTSLALSGPETQFGGGPSVGVLNGDFVVAWLDDGPYRGWFRRLRPDGTFLEAPRALHRPGGMAGYPVVSAAPDHALIAWTQFDDGDGVGLAVLLLDGGLATPPGGIELPAGGATGRPTAGWLGNRHRLAWRERRADGGEALVVATVAFDGGLSFTNHGALATGSVSDPVFTVDGVGWQYLSCLRPASNSFQSFVGTPPSDTTWLVANQAFPGTTSGVIASVAGAGGVVYFLGLASDAGSSFLTSLARQSTSLTPAGQFGVQNARSFAVTALSNGDLYGVIASPFSLRGAVWTPPGAPGSTRLVLPSSANAQRGSSVVAVDGGFLVSWSDSLQGSPGVFTANVTSPAAISPGRLTWLGTVSDQYKTSLAPAPGGAWLLVESPSPVLLRVGETGSVLSPRPIGPADFVLPPVALEDGGVAWASARGLAPGSVSWVLGSGQAGSAPLPSAALFERSLGSTGSRLVASARGSLLWIDLDGGVSDAGLFSQAFSDFSNVLSGSGHVLHVQHAPTGLLVRRLREDGVFLDATPLPVPLDGGNETNRRVIGTWSGNAWELLVPRGSSSEHVTVPLVGAPRFIRSLPGVATSVATGGSGVMLFSRDDIDDSRAVMANRVRLVLVTEAGAQGASCTVNAGCASGFCVQDVCCDAPCQGTCATCRARVSGELDGVCRPVTARLCRMRMSECDAEELCDERSLDCPADQTRPAGSSCAGGVCSTSGVCLPDGGVPDAGAAVDAGLADAGVEDGGAAVDAGLADAGTEDAGAAEDAGARDSGVELDAGRPDAGSVLPDAGADELDGGRSAGRYLVATGCAHAPDAASSSLLLLVLAVLRRRAT